MTKAIKIIEEDSKAPLPPLQAYDNEIGDLSIRLARMLDTIKIKFDLLSEQQHDLEELNQSLELRVGSRTKELKTALNELIKKERLAAIGQMASIVSHEIKNPLAVISNSVYLIKARLGDNIEPKVLKNINVIEGEIKQANGIIEEILGYARSREQILSIVDLTLYVKEILSSYPIPNNIKIETSFHAEPLYIKIDTEEMKQAIRNIMGNAFEVMQEGGTFVVKTKLENGKALVSFRDTGPGIPSEIQTKIFTPFFTTKARGTGLGLAVVRKVATRNKAEIILNSIVGKGTKITLLFNKEEKQ
jgi:signal transduction histidine kinase